MMEVRMRTSRFLTMVGVLLATAFVLAQTNQAAAVVGRWEGQRQAEGRVDNIALVFTEAAKGLSGEVLLNGQIFDQMSNIVVSQNKVTFSMGDLDCAGTLEGNAMRLTAHFQDRDLWTMSLAKKDKD
jgi:hypothetical protein